MNVGIGYLHVGELYLNSAHYIAPDGEKSAAGGRSRIEYPLTDPSQFDILQSGLAAGKPRLALYLTLNSTALCE